MPTFLWDRLKNETFDLPGLADDWSTRVPIPLITHVFVMKNDRKAATAALEKVGIILSHIIPDTPPDHGDDEYGIPGYTAERNTYLVPNQARRARTAWGNYGTETTHGQIRIDSSKTTALRGH